jgi:hypothetical protein
VGGDVMTKAEFNEYRANLKPVGDPFDIENEDFDHPNNLKIQLLQALDETMDFINTGDKSHFVNFDDMMTGLFALADENRREERENGASRSFSARTNTDI